jgi:hypothetical protein
MGFLLMDARIILDQVEDRRPGMTTSDYTSNNRSCGHSFPSRRSP